MSFPHLLAPGRIGTLALRNRIVMSPMGSNLAEPDGRVGARIQRYYEARAAGGAGLVVMGVGAVSFPAGACNPNQVAVSDDAFLPGLTQVAERVHRHGACIAIQLQHAGKAAVRDIAEGRPLLVPSLAGPRGAGDLLRDLTAQERRAFVANLSGPRPQLRAASEEDLARLVEDFASAALRVRRAGFDGVEIHAGHGYILSSFLSPASNRREDRYGGPLENRARLLCETIRAVKQRAGDDFPVWLRMDAVEFRIEGGIGLEDAARTAQLAESAGADAVHVSAYADPTSGVGFTDAPLVHRECGYVDFAAHIKRGIGIPVIAVGRIEPEQADRLVGEGRADFVAMGRKLLADPELPHKLAEGRESDVRPCVYCYTCVAQIFVNKSLYCAVNPETGFELELALEPAPAPRTVLVAGGGPAGLEAARVAALRGHRVTLCEQSDRLGGTLALAAGVYPPNGRLARWLEEQVRKLGVEVRLRQRVTRELVAQLAPDATVVATGARRAPPRVEGAELPHVFGVDALRAVLDGEAALGARVAVVGGDAAGIGLAGWLAERGHAPTLIEEGAHFGTRLAPPRRWRALHELRERGGVLIPKARVVRILETELRYWAEEDKPRGLPADSVVFTTGLHPDLGLVQALRDAGLGGEIHAIGDCGGAATIENAIHEAARVARAI